MCLCGLSQHNFLATMATCLHFMFPSCTDLSINCDKHIGVHSVIYHFPFITKLKLPIRRSNSSSNISFRKYSSGEYQMLYNTPCTYSWSPLYIETFVDAAVDRLTVPLTHVIEIAVPTGCFKRCRFPTCFSNNLNFISGKRITFISVIRCNV